MTRYSKTMAESYGEVVEKLKPSDGAGAYVKDFRKSDAPQFKGKSDKKLRDMAIAAYLDDKEENMKIENKDIEEKMMDAYAVRYHLQGKGRLVQAYKTKPDAEKRAKILKSMGGVKDVSITGPHNLNMKEDMSRYYDDTMLGLGKPKTFNPRNQKFEDYIQELKDDISEAKFEVKIKGLDTMFVDASSAGTVKANLKRMFKNPKDIESVERVSTTDMKKSMRDKLAGKDRFHDLQKKIHKSEEEIQEFKKMTVAFKTHKDMSKASTDLAKQGFTITGNQRALKVDGKGADLNKFAKDLQNFYGAKVKAESKTSYEKYTGVKNPVTEGRRSNYASDDEDEEGANKNIIMQLRKSLNLRNLYNVVFDDGKKVKVKEPIARAAIEKHSQFRTSRDKLAFQNKIGKSYRDLLNAIK